NFTNANPGVDEIDFNIPGAGAHTINVNGTGLGELPHVTEPVTIDAYTQPGASRNTLADGNNAVLLIELNGNSTAVGVNGLTVAAGNSTIEGLVINRFPGSGILLETN